MNPPWFKRNGMLFIPITFPGWIILISVLAYAIYTFINIDSRSHSVSDTLMNFVFNLVLIIAANSIIAFLTSKPALK